jgi:hypothetical protein
MQNGAGTIVSSKGQNIDKFPLFTRTTPDAGLHVYEIPGPLPMGKTRSGLPWMRNTTFIPHKLIANARTVLFLFHMAILSLTSAHSPRIRASGARRTRAALSIATRGLQPDGLISRRIKRDRKLMTTD